MRLARASRWSAEMEKPVLCISLFSSFHGVFGGILGEHCKILAMIRRCRQLSQPPPVLLPLSALPDLLCVPAASAAYWLAVFVIVRPCPKVDGV